MVYDNPDKAMDPQPISNVEAAIQRVNRAEADIGKLIRNLYDQLTPLLNPEPTVDPADCGMNAVRLQPSPIVERLWSHADSLENHVHLLKELSERLDV